MNYNIVKYGYRGHHAFPVEVKIAFGSSGRDGNKYLIPLLFPEDF